MKRLAIPTLLLAIVLVPTVAEGLDGAVRLPADARAAEERGFAAEFERAATRFYDPLFTGWVHNAVGKDCDDWDAWMLGWLREHRQGTVREVEETIAAVLEFIASAERVSLAAYRQAAAEQGG